MKTNQILKWMITTILVIIGVFVLIRLGFWQLDRLDQRRAFNDHYLEQVSLEPINLSGQSIPVGLEGMEYRKVSVEGFFDFKNEIYLQNHAHENQPGYRVVTPLLIENQNLAVLIDRGWISLSDLKNISSINEQYEQAQTINGIIRNPNSKDKIVDTVKSSEDNSNLYLYVDIASVQNKANYQLLPIYIQLEGDSHGEKPIPQTQEIEITEGPHFGYALQWFIFASLLGLGYPFFVRKQVREKTREKFNE